MHNRHMHEFSVTLTSFVVFVCLPWCGCLNFLALMMQRTSWLESSFAGARRVVLVSLVVGP